MASARFLAARRLPSDWAFHSDDSGVIVPAVGERKRSCCWLLPADCLPYVSPFLTKFREPISRPLAWSLVWYVALVLQRSLPFQIWRWAAMAVLISRSTKVLKDTRRIDWFTLILFLAHQLRLVDARQVHTLTPVQGILPFFCNFSLYVGLFLMSVSRIVTG